MDSGEPKLSDEMKAAVDISAQSSAHAFIESISFAMKKLDSLSKWMITGSFVIIYDRITTTDAVPAYYSNYSFKFLVMAQILSVIFGAFYLVKSEFRNSLREYMVENAKKTFSPIAKILTEEIAKGNITNDFTPKMQLDKKLESLGKDIKGYTNLLIQFGLFICSFFPLVAQYIYNF